MDDPIIKIIIISLAVMFVVAVVSIGTILFNTSKGDANENQVALQGQLGDLKQSKYNDYDQKLVSGTQVTAAYNLFKSENIGIVVKTCKGNWVCYNAVLSPFSASESLASIPFKGLTLNATSKQITSSVSFINADSANGSLSFVLDGSGDQSIIRKNGVTTGMYKNGSIDYVNSTATFRSYLILDSGDVIIGIVFVQDGKHT